LQQPSPYDPPPDELLRMMESMDETIKGINSWDDVITFVLSLEQSLLANDPTGIKSDIDKALA
jgi:hypothetical protein